MPHLCHSLFGVSLITQIALLLASGGLRGVETSGSAAVTAGNMDSDSGLNFEGAYAIMLGGGFGFQIDGMYSSIGSTEFKGGGLQFFWQNDSPWLASVGYSHVDGEFVDSDEISADLQFQQSSYSLGAKLGMAQIDYMGRAPFIDDKDDGLLMAIYADFYATDTLRASLGLEYRFDLMFAKVEVEWLTPVEGLSVFANCMLGQNDYDHALVGLRYIFGGEIGTLKARRATPRAMSPATLYGIGNHGALYNSLAKKFIAANQGAGSGGSLNYGGVSTWTATLDLNIISIGSNSSDPLGGSGVIGGGNHSIGDGSVLGPGSSLGGTLQVSGNYSILTDSTDLNLFQISEVEMVQILFD